MKKALLLIILITATLPAYTQTQFCGWLASFNTVKLNKKFSLHLEAQLRSTDKIEGIQTLLLRGGLNYHPRKNMVATAGYGFIHNRRSAAGAIGYVPEHRIWEQFIISHPIGFISLSHRFRLEQRFISKHIVNNGELEHDSYAYSNRFRYFFRGIVPFSGKKDFAQGTFGSFQNEVFLNIGDNSMVNGKLFDQNRLYFSLGYRFSKRFDAELGYMNQYISGSNNATTNNHILQCATYLRL